MNALTTIRAWKNNAFRATLSDSQRTTLRANPAGTSLVELDESKLRGISGGVPGECGLICSVTYDCAESYLAKKACDIWHAGE